MINHGEGVQLTKRQAEVLCLATQGFIAKETARLLGISTRTVEGHLGAIRKLTGARNMAELTAWALSAGSADSLAAVGPAEMRTT